MQQERIINHTWLNRFHTLLLLAGLMAMLGASAYLLAGLQGLLGAVLLLGLMLLFTPRVSPRLILRMYNAVPLRPVDAPELYQLVAALARAAALPRVPQLYYVPSEVMNAFAVGQRDAAAIGITDALLRRLSPRELAGVLAHEVAHIRHNDLWVMNLADLLSRATNLLATIGQLLLLLNVPLLLLGERPISWLGILLLLAAPTIAALLQLALSRTREYDADRGAVALTGDPEGLASALLRLERYSAQLLRQVVLPGYGVPQPSILRTHPHTDDRVARLRQLAGHDDQFVPPSSIGAAPAGPAPMVRRPRYHVLGLWY